MLPHYLWNFKVQICDRLQTSCLIKWNISCCTIRRTMLLSSLQQMLQMSAFCPHTLVDAYATRQLHRQWRSGPCRAKRPANASSVRQCCAAATDALAAGAWMSLDILQLTGLRSVLFVSHRPGGMKAGIDCSRNRTVSPHWRVPCAGALPCWKMKKWYTWHVAHHLATVAATGACRASSRRWSSPPPIHKDEVREAKLWDADGHHNNKTSRDRDHSHLGDSLSSQD